MPDALTVAARANHVLVGVLILAGLAFAAIGAAQNDTFYLRLATEALIFGGLALSVDILLGYTGLLSLGQALVLRAAAPTSPRWSSRRCRRSGWRWPRGSAPDCCSASSAASSRSACAASISR